MSTSNVQHEPTMEEILASIRKIISEDSSEQPAPAQAKPAAEADVLELTQEVHEEPAPPPVVAAAPAPAPVAPAAPPPVSPADDVVFQPIEEAPVSSPAQTAAVSSTEGIFSEKTRKALSDAFTSVEPETQAKPAPMAAMPVAPVDGNTLESIFDRAVRETFDPVLQQWLEKNRDTVVERMKPVITQWLDEHFPAMLEDAVREELARAAKARVRR